MLLVGSETIFVHLLRSRISSIMKVGYTHQLQLGKIPIPDGGVEGHVWLPIFTRFCMMMENGIHYRCLGQETLRRDSLSAMVDITIHYF